MTKRGCVLRDTNLGPGLLAIDGVQYAFTLEDMWRSDVPPRTGMAVDASFTPGGALEGVSAISDRQVAKEKAQAALAGALRQSEVVGAAVKTRFSVWNIILECLLLISFFALPNLLESSMYSGRTLTGWDAIGLDPRTTLTSDHGLLSLFAVLCLFAPAAVPFLKQAWARLLYAAPLAFAAIASLAITVEIRNGAGETARTMGSLLGGGAALAAQKQFTNSFRPGGGAYLVLLFAVLLALRAKPQRTQLALSLFIFALLGAHNSLAQSPDSQSPPYIAARSAAMKNFVMPPLATTAGKNFVAVLTNDADQLNAIAMLYKTASPEVRGAVDGGMVPAAEVLKVNINNIAAAHKCTLAPVSAEVDSLTRAAIQVSSISVCLGGQPKETLGHAIANQGNVRALERQFTLGVFGHGDKAAGIAKAADPKFAGNVDFAVQQIANNFSKTEIAAELSREATSQPSPVAPARAPATVSPPPHPASTVVDLAPAAAGYPPMHASRAAQDGCWWAPFASQKFGLEMAVPHCETNGWAVEAGEDSTGITLLSVGASGSPEHVLTVEAKPAEQSIEAAIRQQFIAKLKVLAARQSCRAQCDTKNDGMISCKVIATGPYSKLKKFNQPDDSSEDPCPDLMSNDAVVVLFLYRPAESKTKFLLYSADDLGGSLDESTIHFTAQP